MYLVKSCFEEFNVFNQKKIKIGTLMEYRNTEDQIVDTREGTYHLEVKLVNAHLPHTVFNQIFNPQQSIASFAVDSIEINGYSPIIKGWDFYKVIKGTVYFTNKNRFIFCISLLDSPGSAESIFKDYNSKWYFNEQTTRLVAYEMAVQIKKEVIKRQREGHSLFLEKFVEKNIEVRYQVQKIEYSKRHSYLTNEDIYQDPQRLTNIMMGARFIKPASFSHEKEVRFCFDVFEYGEILHPKDTSIIIDARSILPLFRR